MPEQPRPEGNTFQEPPARFWDNQPVPGPTAEQVECPGCESIGHSLDKAERRLEAAEAENARLRGLLERNPILTAPNTVELPEEGEA